VAAAGFALLLVRPHLVLPPVATAAILAGIYVVIATGSLGAAVPPATDRNLPPFFVLAFGVTAVYGAAFSAGPPLPVPQGIWAAPLAVGAAVAEEAFFRRFLYGHLVQRGAVVAIFGSALAFAAVHVPVYGGAAFWIDLGAGLMLSWQRWASGAWTVPAATHAFANLLAVM
jgi:membrane protease YdiL (CAAX protease family)